MSTTFFYTQDMFRQEHELAALIARGIGRADRIPAKLGQLKGKQVDALKMACDQRLCMIHGYPGSGKTTTLRQVVESFDAAGMIGAMIGPTGKSAKRADEVINNPTLPPLFNAPVCSTMHSLIKLREAKKFKPETLGYDYLLIDEFPMAGTPIAHAVFQCIDFKRTRVVITGDPFQLPSIDPGNLMNDMIHSEVVPQVQLTEVHRTGKNSGIFVNAQRILTGQTLVSRDPKTGETFEDFFFVARDNPELTKKTIIKYVAEGIVAKYPHFDRVKDIQVLSPGKKSSVGTVELNEALRDAINPQNNRSGHAVGDKVINRKNILALGIVNGEVGVVQEVGAKGVVVDFGLGSGADGKGLVKMEGEHLDKLESAYAYTIHASQGSEYPVCLLPFHKTHYRLLFRNLLYTGETRAKKIALLFGEMAAVEQCIGNNSADRRYSRLGDLIRTYYHRRKGVKS